MPLDIKICGLRTPETVAAALANGATHIGFIFFAKSPRNVAPELAGELRRAAFGRAKAVAVTVDADDATLDRIVSEMKPDLIQLHGKETPQRVAEIKARYGLPVMKASAISEPSDLEKVQPFIGIADRFLFDAKPPRGSELPGGNGVSFDWRLLKRLDPAIDYLLSGGLDAGNVGEALALANPPGIDVSSGVERVTGVKDVPLIDAFFRAVRAAEDSRAAWHVAGGGLLLSAKRHKRSR
jgi:phosphoribosylanthranilate isomerase